MDTTPVSLLQRLRRAEDAEAWNRFVTLATPLLFFWARQQGLASDDAADLVQDVFMHLLKKLPDFIYDPKRSFRGWLKTVTIHKCAERWRRRAPAPMDIDDPCFKALASAEDPDAFWEAEYRQYLVARAMEVMRGEFEATTWQACLEHIVSGRSAAEIADEFGLSPGAVYAGKCRILRRLRQELNGMLD